MDEKTQYTPEEAEEISSLVGTAEQVMLDLARWRMMGPRRSVGISVLDSEGGEFRYGVFLRREVADFAIGHSRTLIVAACIALNEWNERFPEQSFSPAYIVPAGKAR